MIKRTSLIFGLYLLLAIFFTMPIIFMFGSHVMGKLEVEPQDLEGGIWNLWFCKYTLSHPDAIFNNDLAFYPYGYNFFTNQWVLLIGYLSIPLQALFGFPAFYNLLIIILLALNGICGYWLCYYFFKDSLISFICGVTLMFNPFISVAMMHGHHSECIPIFFMCLYVLYLFKTYDEEARINPYLVFLFFLLSTLTYIYFAMYLALFSMVFFIYKYFADPDFFQTSRVRRFEIVFILMAFFFSIFICYFGISNMNETSRIPLFDSLPVEGIMPGSEGSFLLRYLVAESCDFYYPIAVSHTTFFPVYIGWTLFLPFLVFLFTRKKPVFWFISALFFYLLTLGPFLKFNGKILASAPAPLYFIFYKWIPFFSRFVMPYLFMFFLLIPIAILFGYSLAAIKEKLHKKRKLYLSLCFCLLALFYADMFIKGFFPVPVSKVEIPEFYRQIAPGKREKMGTHPYFLSENRDVSPFFPEEDFAIIDVPYTLSSPACLYQMIHQKKLLGGKPERAFLLYPEDYLRFISNNSFIGFLLDLNEYDHPVRNFDREDMAELKEMGFRYIVYHKKYFMMYNEDAVRFPEKVASKCSKTLDSVFGEPVYEDSNIKVYDIK